jgi:hypothetical protein
MRPPSIELLVERPLRGILHSYGTGFVLIGIAVLLLMEPVGQHASSPSPPAPAVIPLPSGGSGASLLAQARASFAEVGSGRTHVPSECANVLQAQYPEVSPGQRSLKEACAYAEARESVSEPGWVLGSQNPPFFYLYDFVLTYDSSDQYVLLFGDPVLPSASAPSETWA